MLCSKCYKKIPEGEEIQKASNFYWRASWASGGGGSEVVCKKCVIKERKWNRKFLWIFVSFLVFFLLVNVFWVIYVIKEKKKN